MTNIKFGNYTAPKRINKRIDLELGIFFDGTLNNKQNTKERENNTEIYRKHGIKTWVGRQINEKNDTSYDNAWSNVARMSESCISKAYPVYIEGIGTEDKQEDDIIGAALGTGARGIRAKVRITCEKVVKKIIQKLNDGQKSEIKTLTLDVFGFSRGAAAARNFVYEINKGGYKAILYHNYGNIGVDTEPILLDSDGYRTDLTHFPPRGHLGLKLQEKKIIVDRIIVRFLGLYDTVSSCHSESGIIYNFDNDVQELHLNEINTAKHVVHFVATDEIRENFDLTHTRIGEEKTFPGVHSDIGGSYLAGEEWVREIATDWMLKSRLKPIEEKLIAEGWFNKDQLYYHGGNAYFALSGKRYVKDTFSFIPLKFMVEKSIMKGCTNLYLSKINDKYNFSQDQLIHRVEKRLRDYVFGNAKSYDFKWFKDINQSYKGRESDPNYIKEINEQKDLRQLRNKYLHWSADRYALGNDPSWNWKRDHH